MWLLTSHGPLSFVHISVQLVNLCAHWRPSIYSLYGSSVASRMQSDWLVYSLYGSIVASRMQSDWLVYSLYGSSVASRMQSDWLILHLPGQHRILCLLPPDLCTMSYVCVIKFSWLTLSVVLHGPLEYTCTLLYTPRTSGGHLFYVDPSFGYWLKF